MLASIRFDLKNEEKFFYYTNYSDFNVSISTHLPDPRLGYPSSSTGSDVLRMLERFLLQSTTPICGTRSIILLKRYPNEVDISSIVQKLQKYHINLSILSAITPSGGTHQETMYQLATKTNGFCVFDDDFRRASENIPNDYVRYISYASNVRVSGKGSITLPPLVIHRNLLFITLTVQDHAPLDYFQHIKLSWFNSNSTNSDFCELSKSDLVNYTGNLMACSWRVFDPVIYSMTLDYEYSGQSYEWVQIRFSTDLTIHYWNPFDN